MGDAPAPVAAGQLVHARTRVKNEIHAVLMRQLIGRPPVSDLFGANGRAWLSELELPDEERETIDSVRQVDFIDEEIAQVERLIAQAALESDRDQAADDGARGRRDRRRELLGSDRERRALRKPAQARRLPGP